MIVFQSHSGTSFCSSIQPDKVSAVRKDMLGKCIEKWVENKNVKGIAKRAAWIGNDETHYERRHTKHDLQDLKNLI